jgi:uncharacterized coiled-coil protein SlyX
MEDLENLGQRIYDIQQCLSYAVSGEIDLEAISELTTKLGNLEESLSVLEERVATQMACAKEIPGVVNAVKELFFMCQDIPEPNKPESTSVVVELKKTLPSRSQSLAPHAPLVVPQAPTVTPIAQSKPNQPPPEDSGGDSFIRYVTDEELKNVSKSVFFRVPMAKVNVWIDEINGILTKRQQVIKLPSNGVKASLKRAWERYDSEKLEDDTRIFFTMEDVKSMPTLKNNQKNALTLLQSLGRIYSSTDSQLKRWFVK